MKTSRLPRVVWLLGLVSLCMDLSSEMIHSLLPMFLKSELGVSLIVIGLIEGIAEGTASISKVFSGVLSDRFGRRKPLIVVGYGLAALSKPLFPLANSAGWVFVARFADRIGKGIRGAPRDALIADITPSESRGAAYGLRQALDTTGALLGPLVAIGLMMLLAGSYRKVFWLAAVPAIAAVAMLVLGVKEPERHIDRRERPKMPRWREVRQFPFEFWIVVAIGAVFTLARFSEAFLVVRASDAGLPRDWIPLALAVMNLTYVISAYPAGWLSDRVGRVKLLAIGLAIIIVADVVLATGSSLTVVLAGVALWGLHLGLTQGVFSALVADTVPADLRGGGFGAFNFVSGLVAIPASVLAGALWDWHGPWVTFTAGATFSAVALAALIGWKWRFSHDESKRGSDH